MSLLSRGLVPLVRAFGAPGTWPRHGPPRLGDRVGFAGARAVASVAGAARELTPGPVRPPPLDRGPGPVDASAIPDPPPPWPRLNPEDDVERAWLVAQGPAHAAGDGRRTVTFTFDDGPFPETAPTVLKILADHHVRATFFPIGKYLAGDTPRAVDTRAWAKRIVEAGHLVGNHTMDHKELTALPHAAALAEIDDSAATLERATGSRPVLFRPPYGELNPWLQGQLRDRHLELQLWSIDVEDMKRDDPDDITQALRTQLEYAGGGVVLLHDMQLAVGEGVQPPDALGDGDVPVEPRPPGETAWLGHRRSPRKVPEGGRPASVARSRTPRARRGGPGAEGGGRGGG